MGASIYSLIPELRPWAEQLLLVAGQAGLQPRITSTRRSHAEQTRLYRQFVSGGRAYPVAPPGTSAHEFGYAFDMVIAGMDPSDFRDLGTVWEAWGGVWGGALNDPIHFEYPGFRVSTVQPRPRGVSGDISPGFLERLHALSEAHPYLSFLLGFVPYVGEAEIVAEAGYYGKKFAEYLRG